MSRLTMTARCPHCGRPLSVSEVPGYVYQCDECDEDFYEFEAEYAGVQERDMAMEALWERFGDVPMNPETEQIEAAFLLFRPGTKREDIWRWFDERYSKGVYHLLYGKRRAV